MKNLFTMGELMTHNPCTDGLTRLTSGLGTYSGPTIITIDSLGPLIPSDILWCLKLLPISEHEQKVICVKTAVFAANSVAHLTDDPHAATCRAAAQAWLDNPCEETQNAAAAAAGCVAAVGAAMRGAVAAMRGAVARAVATNAAWAAEEGSAWAASVEGGWAANAAARADLTTRPKIKAYLINLIRELNE